MIRITEDTIGDNLNKQKKYIFDFHDLLLTLSELILSFDETNCYCLSNLSTTVKGDDGLYNHVVLDHDKLCKVICKVICKGGLVTGLPLVCFKVLAYATWITIQEQVSNTSGVDLTEFNPDDMFLKEVDGKKSKCHIFNLKTYFDNFKEIVTISDIGLARNCIEELFLFADENHILTLKDNSIKKADTKQRLFNAGKLLSSSVLPDNFTPKLLLLVINLTFFKLCDCKYENVLAYLKKDEEMLNRLIYVLFGSNYLRLKKDGNSKIFENSAYTQYNQLIKKLDLSEPNNWKYLIRATIKFVYDPLLSSDDSAMELEERLFSITKRLYTLSKTCKEDSIKDFDENVSEAMYRNWVLFNLFNNIKAKENDEANIGSRFECYYTLLLNGMGVIQEIIDEK